VLRTLGGLRLEGASFSKKKPLLLTAYLALEGPKSRRHLQELFWPRAEDQKEQPLRGPVPTQAGRGGDLRATAFAGDQPLSALLAARPIPQETFAAHSLFLDRMWPVHLEAALLQSTFTW
jgi:hypothetical protein